jgi:ribosomal protein L6P/L9E
MGNNILNSNELCTKQSLFYNSILGSYAPFTKTFIIRGIGYQADIIENDLVDNAVKEFPYNRYLSLRVGHSYNLYAPIPDYIGVKVSHKDRKLVIYGASKEKVANFAKKI